MDLLVLLVLGALTLIGAAFSKLLADEFKAWAPTIVSSILAIAVKVLPPSQRDRAAEEWTSHVNELPGDLSRVVFACGCILAALKIDGLPFRVGMRILDIGAGVLGLALLAPLLGICFIAIKLTSPGPVLFGQRRVGANGRKFLLYKLRTLEIENPQPSRVGRILRALSLDELPQWLNVLKGDMTIVGPRPLPENANGSSDLLNQRPGITDSWKALLVAAKEMLGIDELVHLLRKLFRLKK
jgi:Bacterial sugar transferase